MTTNSTDTQVLAIDGGGTRCRFALARGSERIVIERGPANATSDFDATVHCLRDGLATLAQLAGVAQHALHRTPAFVGLAGVTSEAIANRLQASLPLRRARYSEDRVAALRGAFGAGNGIIAHCGTGSFFAAQVNGAHRFAGGWGSVLGDEASAQWVGRRALSAVLQQADGFLPESPLTKSLLDRYRDTDGILSFANTATPKQLGELAPIVTEQAREHDCNAQQILRAAAVYVAHGIEQMGWQAGTPVCLTGGIGRHYEPYLSAAVRQDLAQAIGEPLDGAVQLALQQAEDDDGHR